MQMQPMSNDFEHEVARLRLKGGDPEPERRSVVIGVLLVVAGFVLLVFAVFGTRGAQTAEAQNDYLVLSPLGLALCVVGSVIWARNSLSRYLRFWLVRLIYEFRASVPREPLPPGDGLRTRSDASGPGVTPGG